MTGGQGVVLIQRLFERGSHAGLDEQQLLERFVSGRDESAFATLVERHGPMVLGVCRRLLRDAHAADDAFQVTFLILAQRAASVRDPSRLGPWLHGVARRVALRARNDAARRRTRERPEVSPTHATCPGDDAERAELLQILDEEIGRLPARFRDVFVLCDLEGRSYADVAHRLDCPLGTVQSRLARGRARLRGRLALRGLAPVTVGAVLAENATAAVSEALTKATAAVASGVAVAVPLPVAALLDRVLRGMIMTKLWTLAVGAASVSIAVLIAVGILARGAPPAVELPPPAQVQKLAPGRTVILRVVSAADQRPIAGATVALRVFRARDQTSFMKTDGEGQTPIVLPGDARDFHYLMIAAPGYVPTEIRRAGTEFPDAYTVTLEPGERIGGTVVDQQGRPIVGARVAAVSAGKYATVGEIAAVMTDAQGRWRSETLPAGAGPDSKVALQLIDDDHVTAGNRIITAREARAFSNVQVMTTGASVEGTVLDPAGRPVAGAIVVVSQAARYGEYVSLKTGAEGRFRSGRSLDPSRSEAMLSVQAKGFASVVRHLVPTPPIPPQVVRLAPTRPLRGRVVDPLGQPVAGASVAHTREFGGGIILWETETDVDGRFAWPDAPATGSLFLNVYKAPFTLAMDRLVDSGAGEATITLHRPLHLHGTVNDAETGQPIERFVVVPGWGPGYPIYRTDWLRSSGKTLSGGKYDLVDFFPDQGGFRSIRVEADGYLPGELLGFRDDAEDIAHDFRLHKARPLSGIIRGPDGRPLEGAEVSLSGQSNHIRIDNGRLETNLTVGTAVHTRTDAEGRYTFHPQEERVGLVVLHDTGFAAQSPVQLAASSDVSLAPWGRIEGVMRIGPQTASKQTVAAWLTSHDFTGRVDYETETDDQGRFIIERVTPGRLTVYRHVRNEDNTGWTPSNPVDVDVAPGETARVDVGGTGRPVAGRLAVPEGVALADLVCGTCGLSAVRPRVPRPDDYPDFTHEQKAAWFTAFFKTPAGRAYADSDRRYAVALAHDGAFRIDDVPAGRYVLRLSFKERARDDGEGRLASAQADVVVPEIAGGRSDEPLAIAGVPLEVFPVRDLNVGDTAPTVTTGAADGRPLDLAVYRGKFVMLAFWATWRDDTLAAIPHLKAAYDAFGRDGRLAIVGLSLDEDPETPKRYAARHRLTWEQRYLGNASDPNPVTAAFGMRWPYGVFLIGPDGKVVAKGLHDEGITRAVAQALAK